MDPLLAAALAAGGLASLAAGVMSPLVVASGSVFLAVEMVHAVLAAGVVGGLAFALGWRIPPIAVAALVVVLLSLFATALMELGMEADTAVGVTAFLSAVIVALGLYALVRVDPTGGSVVTGLLVGNAFLVSRTDLQGLLAVAAIVAAAVYLFGREIAYVYFDPESSEVAGVRTGAYRALLNSLVAITALGLTYVLGVLMAHIILVAPGVAAHRSARRSISSLLAASVGASLTAVLSAVALAWETGLNAAAASGITVSIVFLAMLAAARLAGRGGGRGP
ncbi:MAG: metal ABC transporter permease [Desulfurococcales archaeon]|nr:metal ABC transporter permease [Desulfurococcales archaeon]